MRAAWLPRGSLRKAASIAMLGERAAGHSPAMPEGVHLQGRAARRGCPHCCKEFPLNAMYWVGRGEEAGASGQPRYEVTDGQQRAICGREFPFEEMRAGRITPWCKGGRTTPDNCQMPCADCNLKKGGAGAALSPLPISRCAPALAPLLAPPQ